MFSFIKKALTKIYTSISSKLSPLFGKQTIDENTLKELEIILLAADTGVATTKSIMQQLREKHTRGELQEGASLKTSLHEILTNILEKPKQPDHDAQIFILVGINGSGKTTFASKIAHKYIKEGKKVLFVAADTFRAAAPEQLSVWAKQTGCDVVQGKEKQDPASVVFAGCQKFIDEKYDIVIIDTAGRLQTKVNLMNELSKLKRVIEKKIPGQPMSVLLTIDSMLGQNSLEQARLFKTCTNVDGIVLTKMDGTGKGGILFAIANELDIPITYITFGEQINQMKLFNKKEFIDNLLNT